ncbi:MAG: hypothetical protein LUH19_08750 [Lachnospiraceae bacterium]|nr:hypothetical protein [Lachnospiraceae bacterium]
MYSFTGNLVVEDPAYAFNRVTVTFTWDETGSKTISSDASVQYRKTLKEDGTFTIDNLPPGTLIRAEFYLQYYDAKGVKVKETESFATIEFTTLSFSEENLDTLYIQFDDDETGHTRLEKQISIYDLMLSGANEYLLGKVNYAYLLIYENTGTDTNPTEGDTWEVKISSSTLKKYMYSSGDYVTASSLSPALNPSGNYRYEFKLYDRFGNCFNDIGVVNWGYADQESESTYVLASGYDVDNGVIYHPIEGAAWDKTLTLGTDRFWGYAYSAKSAPTAGIKQITISDSETTLSQADMTITVSDLYDALVSYSESPSGSYGGSMPQKDEESDEYYNVYFQIFKGDETEAYDVAVAYGYDEDDRITDVYLQILDEDDEDSAGVTGDQTNYISSASLGDDAGDLTYHVTGMTAGTTYEIRVYADYDLNDLNGTVSGAQIGYMSFSTLAMSSYGRIYYSLASEHILTDWPSTVDDEGDIIYIYDNEYDHDNYESATAQDVSIYVNTKRTNATLAKYYYYNFHITMKDKSSGDVLYEIDIYRNNTDDNESGLPSMSQTVEVSEEDLVLTDDGYYRYTLYGVEESDFYDGCGAEYTYTWGSSSELLNVEPELYIDIPWDTYLSNGIIKAVTDGTSGTTVYQFDLWEAFIGVISEEEDEETTDSFLDTRSLLTMHFDEDYLKSYSGYTITLDSYAAQGTVKDHVVTASSSSYKQVRFTTLKEMPYVTIDGVLQVGKYLYLEGIELHDPDQSIYGGEVKLYNKSSSSTDSVTVVLDYTSTDGIVLESDFDNFSGLRTGTSYTFSVVPTDIRRTGKTTSPRLQNETLYSDEYTAGQGVTGEITVSNLSYPLSVGVTEVTYSKYEVGNFTFGWPTVTRTTVTDEETGTTTTTESVTYTNTTNISYETMDPISVTPGQVYYFHNLTSGSTTVRLIYLDAAQEPIGGTYREITDDSYIKIPEGVYYIQASMYGYIIGTDGRTSLYSASQAQLLLVYDSSDSILTKLGLVSAQHALDTDNTKSITFTAEELKGKEQLAVVNGEWGSDGSQSFTFSYYVDGASGSATSVTAVGGYTLDLSTLSYSSSVTVVLSSTLSGYGDSAGLQTLSSAGSFDVRRIDTDQLSAFSDYDTDNLYATYLAEVTDNERSLADTSVDNVRVVVTDSGTGQVVSSAGQTGQVSYATSTSIGTYSKTQSFETETGDTYKLVLSICWRGKWYTLDEQTVTAEGIQYSISTPTQLLKTVTWPRASFIVTADLEDVNYLVRQIVNQTFYGTLDGQGHTLSANLSDTTSNTVLFNVISASAVIENFNFDIDSGGNGEATNYKYLISANSGTIRNVVVTYNTGNRNARHTYNASLCYRNTGTIENFALYLENATTSAGAYVPTGFGSIVVNNAGTISNGFVYSAYAVNAYTNVYGGDESVSISSVGGVASNNQSSGVIENVMVVMTLRVEQNANALTATSKLTSYGLIAGSNSGLIRNCVTNGDILYVYWDGSTMSYTTTFDTVNWPGSYNRGSAYTKNCYYVASSQYIYNDAYTSYVSSSISLTAASFYTGSVNSDGAFVVDSQLENGYYPIVDMPDCMEGLQWNIAINASGISSRPSYLGSGICKDDDDNEMIYYEYDVLDDETAATLKELLGDLYETYVDADTNSVQKQFAIMSVNLSNRSGYNIYSLTMTGLTAEILESDTSNYVTELTVLLTPYLNGELSRLAESYSNSIDFESLEYGFGETADSGSTTLTVEETLNGVFSYPLSYDTWNSSMTPYSTTDTIVNYRLVEDICLDPDNTGFDSSDDRLFAVRFFSYAGYNTSYGGTFDGGGHTLDFNNVTTESMGSGAYFATLLAGACVKDVWVENLTVSGTVSTSSNYRGFIGYANSGVTIEGVNLTNVEILDAVQYAGSLLAYGNSVNIIDCTAANIKVASGSSASSLYAGGLVGSMQYSNIYNSYVRSLEMDTTAGTSVSGTGGLVGNATDSWSQWCVIDSCYVQGTINTSFANCGGVLGYGGSQISQVWTAVNIYGTKYIGSIIGTARCLASVGTESKKINNCVVSGELYSDSTAIGSRLVGYWQISSHENITQTYAYEGQLINSSVSSDEMDATSLSTAKEMKTYYFWQDVVGLGDSYNYYGASASEIENGEEDISDVTEENVYPILYNKDGTDLLPQQAQIEYVIETPDFEIIEEKTVAVEYDTQANAIAAVKALNSSLSDTDATSIANSGYENFYGYYDLTVVFRVSDLSGYDISDKSSLSDLISYLQENITADGLDLSSSAQWTVAQDEDDESAYYVTVKGVQATKRFDSYRIVYQFSDSNSVSSKIVFQNSDGTADVNLYWMISDAVGWTTLLGNSDDAHGYNSENFRIMKSFSLNGYSLTTGLKLNRLEGDTSGWSSGDYENKSQKWLESNEFVMISGATISSAYAAWIQEISTNIAYLEFSGITLTEAASADYFGIVGNVVGTAQYLDFNNITLNVGAQTGTYNYLGCLAYCGGTVSNCRLADIKIDSPSNYYYYNYVGGLTGYAAIAENVYGFGTGSGTYKITMANSTVASRTYFGGLVGYVLSSMDDLLVENITVTGRNYTGGVVGYFSGGSSSSKSRFPDEDEAWAEAVDTVVSGYNYAGGVLGGIYSGVCYSRAVNCTVTTEKSYAGGAIGYVIYGNMQGLEAYNCTVTAGESYAGGLVGYKQYSGTLTYSKAYNTTVTATTNYAGGLIGWGNTGITGSAAYGVTVKATSYAGGLIGCLANGSYGNYSNGHHIYRSVVMGTSTITANNYAGGLAGAAGGLYISYNEVGQDVTVNSSSSDAGGVTGYLSGGQIDHNIVACTISGMSNVGGLMGEVDSYGSSLISGGSLTTAMSVSKAYSNVIACQDIYGAGIYVAGVAGLFNPGDWPTDGDGNLLTDVGYKDWMSSEYFYNNAVIPYSITTGGSSSRMSWYANYTGTNATFNSYLDKNGETEKYDYYISGRNKVSVDSSAIAITESTLRTVSFYTTTASASSKGLGFSSKYIDTSDVTSNYYPYVKLEEGYAVTPYQTGNGTTVADSSDLGLAWNVYYVSSSDSAGGTTTVGSTLVAFTGTGIPIGASNSILLASLDYSPTAYASGINTINIDFSNIDTTMVTFQISYTTSSGTTRTSSYSIEDLATTNYVCTLTYDFATDFTLTLYSEDQSDTETFTFRASYLCNTVMTWNNSEYYIKTDGVYLIDGDSSTCVLEGEFIHLYGGKALGSDGVVYSLD